MLKSAEALLHYYQKDFFEITATHWFVLAQKNGQDLFPIQPE